MSAPGWYPDPGGQRGMYRYWDGSNWSAAISPTNTAGPPPGVLGAPAGPPGDPTQPIITGGANPTRPGQGATGQGYAGQGYPGQAYPGQGNARQGDPAPGQQGHGYPGQTPFNTASPSQPSPNQPYQNQPYQNQAYRTQGSPGRPGPGPVLPGGSSARKWWIIGAIGLIVLVVVAAFAVRGVTQASDPLNGDRPGSSSRSVCPDYDLTQAQSAPTRDGRVHGGLLSYPTLPPPWSAPAQEFRVPFGRDAWTQTILVERYGQNGEQWVASTLIGELRAGDGFFSPQQGSEIVVKCIVGSFYGDAKVDREDRVNKATTVDGHEAWLVESHLSFDISGLQTKGELAIVMIVATSDSEASIFYASIPDTTPQWEAPARAAMSQLRVG